MRFRWLSRVLSWLAAALVGAVYGVAGTIAHSLSWGPIPVGLIIGTIACAAILIAVRALTEDRGATLAAGVGLVGMVMVISGKGPGGSIIVPDTPLGQIWTYVVAGLVLLVVAWPTSRTARAPQHPAAPPRAPQGGVYEDHTARES